MFALVTVVTCDTLMLHEAILHRDPDLPLPSFTWAVQVQTPRSL